MDANFYAERAARNIHQLGYFEEEALRKSPEFRNKVIEAYERIYGSNAKLKIEMKRDNIFLSWFRPTDRIYSLPHEIYVPAKSLAIKFYKTIIEETEKKGLNPGKFNIDELAEFVSNIIKKGDSPVRFSIQTYDEKYVLFGSIVDSNGEKKPIILIFSGNSKNDTIDVALLVSIYSIENTMYDIPHAILISHYRFNPDSDFSEKVDYIPMGFKSLADLINIFQWYKQ